METSKRGRNKWEYDLKITFIFHQYRMPSYYAKKPPVPLQCRFLGLSILAMHAARLMQFDGQVCDCVESVDKTGYWISNTYDIYCFRNMSTF